MICAVTSMMLSHCETVGTLTPSGAARSVRLRVCPHRLAKSARKRRKVARSRMALTARTSRSR